MTKEEASKKKTEIKEKITLLYNEIIKLLDGDLRQYFPDDILIDIKDTLNEPAYSDFYKSVRFEFLQAQWEYVNNRRKNNSSDDAKKRIALLKQEFENITNNTYQLTEEYFHLQYELEFGIDKHTDMEMEFDGDIIITDPCYIIREEADDLEYEIAESETDISRYGFTSYMKRSTLYGDWTCTTYDTRTGRELGHFAADGGMVGVFLLDEVQRYNPLYKINEGSWCVTCIKDFKGIVEFKVEKVVYDWGDIEEVRVYGHGINKKTGEPIEFIGKQTNL